MINCCRCKSKACEHVQPQCMLSNMLDKQYIITTLRMVGNCPFEYAGGAVAAWKITSGTLGSPFGVITMTRIGGSSDTTEWELVGGAIVRLDGFANYHYRMVAYTISGVRWEWSTADGINGFRIVSGSTVECNCVGQSILLYPQATWLGNGSPPLPNCCTAWFASRVMPLSHPDNFDLDVVQNPQTGPDIGWHFDMVRTLNSQIIDGHFLPVPESGIASSAYAISFAASQSIFYGYFITASWLFYGLFTHESGGLTWGSNAYLAVIQRYDPFVGLQTIWFGGKPWTHDPYVDVDPTTWTFTDASFTDWTITATGGGL
jgi:hypothetical protein